MKPALVIDIETDGRPPQVGELLCVGFQLADQTTANVVGFAGMDDLEATTLQRYLESMLADPSRPVVSHSKYDARYLKLQGWEVTGPYHDTMVMAATLNENQPLGLAQLAKRYLGLEMDKRIKRRDGVPWFTCDNGKLELMADAPRDQLHRYNAEDVEATTKLYLTLRDRLEQTAWLDHWLEEEVPFTAVLLDMEVAGLPVDLEASEKLRARLEVEAEETRTGLLQSADIPAFWFNLDSGTQLANFLYNKVVELPVSLDLGEWAVGAVKSCVAGEHDDCPEEPEQTGSDLYRYRHVVDFLPPGFTLDRLGRTQAHGWYTFKGLGLTPTEKTPGGDRWSTSSPVLKNNLAAMQDPWVGELLRYRQVQKLLTTYLRRWPEQAQRSCDCDDLAHTTFNNPSVMKVNNLPGCPSSRLFGTYSQAGTKTGRLSSSNPNMQNLPAHGPLGEEVRGLFRGNLVVGDYDQLEMRLQASFSEDPAMMRAFREGLDPHLLTAQHIFGNDIEPKGDERGIGKTLNFAMGYGAGPPKVASILTVNGYPTDADTAKGYLREMRALYATFFNWREAVMAEAKRKGYVSTIGGRHRRLKAAFEDRKNWKNIGYGERQAVNAVVQGSAADVLRKVMVACQTRVCYELHLLAQVHDELVFEWDDGQPNEGQLAELKHVAETAHGFRLVVPLLFDPHYGTSWFAAKEGIELPDDMYDPTEGAEE